MSDIERRALELWREREMQFPERVRRMNPDDMDRASGAWQRMVDAEQTQAPASRPEGSTP